MGKGEQSDCEIMLERVYVMMYIYSYISSYLVYRETGVDGHHGVTM